MKELTGRSALITGASRGIGRSVSLALAGAGMEVGLVARSTDKLEALAAEIKEAEAWPSFARAMSRKRTASKRPSPGALTDSVDLIAGTHLARRLDGECMLEPEDVAECVVFLARQPANVAIPEMVMLRGK